MGMHTYTHSDTTTRGYRSTGLVEKLSTGTLRTENQRIPQFRLGVETELAHIGNRKPEDTTV
jgi:hypothetical protein